MVRAVGTPLPGWVDGRCSCREWGSPESQGQRRFGIEQKRPGTRVENRVPQSCPLRRWGALAEGSPVPIVRGSRRGQRNGKGVAPLRAFHPGDNRRLTAGGPSAWDGVCMGREEKRTWLLLRCAGGWRRREVLTDSVCRRSSSGLAGARSPDSESVWGAPGRAAEPGSRPPWAPALLREREIVALPSRAGQVRAPGPSCRLPFLLPGWQGGALHSTTCRAQVF